MGDHATIRVRDKGNSKKNREVHIDTDFKYNDPRLGEVGHIIGSLAKFNAKIIHRSLPYYAQTQYDFGDLFNHAVIAGIKHLDKFDYNHCSSLTTFLNGRIKNSIFDFLRDVDPLGKYGRKKVKEVFAKREKLEKETSGSVSLSSTVSIMGEKYYRPIEENFWDMISLNSRVNRFRKYTDESMIHEEIIGENDKLARKSNGDVLKLLTDTEMNEFAEKYIYGLQDTECYIIHSYFWDHRTLREIGEK